MTNLRGRLDRLEAAAALRPKPRPSEAPWPVLTIDAAKAFWAWAWVCAGLKPLTPEELRAGGERVLKWQADERAAGFDPPRTASEKVQGRYVPWPVGLRDHLCLLCDPTGEARAKGEDPGTA